MRFLLRLFLGLALLFGGLEPVVAQAEPRHATCCCGDEASCPCPPPPTPTAPRCPSPAPGPAPALVTVAPRRAEAQTPRQEAHPCPAPLRLVVEAGAAQAGLVGHPEPRPSPPNLATHLALLSTFRN